VGRLWKQCWEEEGNERQLGLWHNWGTRSKGKSHMALLRRFVCTGLSHAMNGSTACMREESVKQIQKARHIRLWLWLLFNYLLLQIGIFFPILVLDDPIQVTRRVPSEIRDVQVNHIRRDKVKDRVFHLHHI
jgi:hypothetical protein